MQKIARDSRLLLAGLVVLAALAAGPAVAGGGRPAFLGVMGKSVEGGVKITGVARGSPAERAGLKPGDVILAVDSTRIGYLGDDEEVTLEEALKEAGDVARLTVRLAGRERKIVKLNVQIRPRGERIPRRPLVLGVRTRLVEGGALITEVIEGTPAHKAGLKVGDIIQAVDSTRVGLLGDDEEVTLREALREAGQVARFTVRLAGPGRKIIRLNIRLNK